MDLAQSYLQRKLKHAWMGGIAKALSQSESACIDEADMGRCDNIMGNMKVLVLDEIDLLLGSAAGNKVSRPPHEYEKEKSQGWPASPCTTTR
jgi:hypothetical protein